MSFAAHSRPFQLVEVKETAARDSYPEPVFVIVQGALESILPAYVFWEAGMKNRIAVPAHQAGIRFLGSLKGLQIRDLCWVQCGDP